jgi:toxin secretion/phage lysis holin
MDKFLNSIYIETGLVGVAITELMHSMIFWIFISLIVIDVLAGKAKALKFQVLDSSVGLNGTLKHVIVILIVVGISVFSRIAGLPEFSVGVKLFFAFDYATSIIENLDVLGIPLPDVLTQYFNRIRSEYNYKYKLAHRQAKEELKYYDKEDKA